MLSARDAVHIARAQKEGSATPTIAKYSVSCVHHNNLAFACSIAHTFDSFQYGYLIRNFIEGQEIIYKSFIEVSQ